MTARWNSTDLARSEKGKEGPKIRPPVNERPAAPVMIPPSPPEATEKPITRRFIWQVAEGLHAEQFPDRFRLVITGPLDEQAAVEHALLVLKQQFKP